MSKYRITITGDFKEEDGFIEEGLKDAVTAAAVEAGMPNVITKMEDEHCIAANDNLDLERAREIIKQAESKKE